MVKDKVTPTLTTHQKMNLETAKIGWDELQRFFAMGRLVVVDPGLDLVDIASNFVDDHSGRIENLLEANKVRIAAMDDARKWNEDQSQFWAVVAAPWVLVQQQGSPEPGDQDPNS